MDCVITLVGETYTKNEYGVQILSTTKRQVFAKVNSVTRTEFFGGGRNGLNPSYRFDVFHGDYGGESIIEFLGERFAVYRTFRGDSDYLELYVERKGGTNEREQTNQD